MNKIFYLYGCFVLLMLPAIVFAFNPGNVPNNVSNITVEDLIDILFTVMWPIIVSAIIVIFVAIGFLFATAQGDPAKLANARLALIGGIVITVIVLLAFSIPFIVRNTIGNGI